MQDTPDAPTLLEALAQFMGEQIQPAITDRGLGFRVRVATFLLQVLAREARLGPEHAVAEAARLRDLFSTPPPPDGGPALEAWLVEANTRLAEALRADRFDADQLAATAVHLKATLRETLAVVQPRFDLRADVERSID